MNRLLQPSGAASGVVTDYIGANLRAAPVRKFRRARKRGYPGFRIRMMDFYVKGIRAVAECTGLGVSHFVYQALLAAMHKAAAQIGMDPLDIARLNKRARAEIRRKYRLGMIANRVLKPERN